MCPCPEFAIPWIYIYDSSPPLPLALSISRLHITRTMISTLPILQKNKAWIKTLSIAAHGTGCHGTAPHPASSHHGTVCHGSASIASHGTAAVSATYIGELVSRVPATSTPFPGLGVVVHVGVTKAISELGKTAKGGGRRKESIMVLTLVRE